MAGQVFQPAPMGDCVDSCLGRPLHNPYISPTATPDTLTSILSQDGRGGRGDALGVIVSFGGEILRRGGLLRMTCWHRGIGEGGPSTLRQAQGERGLDSRLRGNGRVVGDGHRSFRLEEWATIKVALWWRREYPRPFEGLRAGSILFQDGRGGKRGNDKILWAVGEF